MKCKLITTASDINRTMHYGMFPGIETVSRAVDELLPNAYYKEIASVVHIRVFQRIK